MNTGPFRQAVWSITNGQCLRRNFNGQVPDAAQVQFGLNLGSFNSFESFLRVNLHNTVHCRIRKFIGMLELSFSSYSKCLISHAIY